MGLGDSDGRGELPLIRLAKLTGLKGNPHVSSKRGFRGLLRSAAGPGYLLLSLNGDVAQGKAFGPWSQTHGGQDLIQSSVRAPALSGGAQDTPSRH